MTDPDPDVMIFSTEAADADVQIQFIASEFISFIKVNFTHNGSTIWYVEISICNIFWGHNIEKEGNAPQATDLP